MKVKSKAFGYALSGLIIATILMIALGLGYRATYPHGLRAGSLPVFMLAVREYALDHDGWYPKGPQTSFECLQQLYPQYADAQLAGLSGSESQVMALLKSGGKLNDRVSSWEYWPGFRLDDNSRVAIIWEREEGLLMTGTRGDGHAVGFADGLFKQISSSEWPQFVKDQEDIRQQILAERKQKQETVKQQ